MNKLALAALLIGAAPLASADYRVINADGSALSELCVAAVVSKDALRDTARAQGLDAVDLETVRCNGLNLRRFAARFGKPEDDTNRAYVLKRSDDSPLTQLCIAATRSEQEYEQVMAAHFTADAGIEAEARCNGLPLRTFARRYKTTDMSVSLR